MDVVSSLFAASPLASAPATVALRFGGRGALARGAVALQGRRRALAVRSPVAASVAPGLPVAGVRVLGAVRLEQELSRSDAAAVFLADDEGNAELVLAVVGLTELAREAVLATLPGGPVKLRSSEGPWHLALVALEEVHLVAFGHRLLDVPPEGVGGPCTERSAPSVIGSLFAGRYRIEAWIGRGGMGDVFRAYDETFARRVALKILRVEAPGTHEAEATRRKLLHEARLVAALSHPHIVQVHDAATWEQRPYLVLELCEGGSLRAVLDAQRVAGGALNGELHGRWALQVADALIHAHGAGVVHRDVKPENIVLTAASVAKVTDFGIAQALATGPSAGIAGTPRYMAPEQLLGQPVDARADQYAWACLTFELFTGEAFGTVAHAGADPGAVLESSALPAAVRLVLGRALAPRREDRYASLAEARHALAAALSPPADGGHAATLAPMALDHRPRKGRGARGVVAGAVALAAAAVGAAAVLFAGRTAPPVAPRPQSSGAAVAEAVAAMADASSARARRILEAAVHAHPGEGAAALFLVAFTNWHSPAAREDLARAWAQRAELPEEERALATALVPLSDNPPDAELTQARILDAVAAHPGSLPLRLAAASVLARMNAFTALLEVAEALPEPARSRFHGRALSGIGEPERARAALLRCLATSPLASDCLELLARIETHEGACDAAEQHARKLVAANPEGYEAYTYLARAVFGRSQVLADLKVLLEERTARAPLELRPEIGAASALVVSVVGGDGAAWRSGADAWIRASLATSDSFRRGQPLLWSMELDEDLGRPADALRTGRRMLAGASAWLPTEYFDASLAAACHLHRLGGMGHEEFVAAREASRARLREHGGYLAAGGLAWWQTHAACVRNEADGVAALAVMPPDASSWDPALRGPRYDFYLGEFFRVLGRSDDAIPPLRRAARSCAYAEPLLQMRARVALAGLLEARGETNEACAHYAFVRDRIGRVAESATGRAAVAGAARCARRGADEARPP